MEEIHHIHTTNLPHDHGNFKLQDFLKANLAETAKFQSLAEVFKLLDDYSRLRVFWVLCHCEECVANISALLEMSSPAVSHHLKILKTAGLIESRRDGKEVYYTAANTETVRLLHKGMEMIMAIHCR